MKWTIERTPLISGVKTRFVPSSGTDILASRAISGIAGKSVGWAGAAADAKATLQSMQEMRELVI